MTLPLYSDKFNPQEFDDFSAANDPMLSEALIDDPASIGRRTNYATVYLLKNKDEIFNALFELEDIVKKRNLLNKVYFALGQIDIEIGQTTLDLGTIVAEKKYDVSGLATLNDVPEDGMVIFTSMSDLDDTTTFEVTKFGGYSGSLLPGNYYVNFQDGVSSKHYSFTGQITLNEPKEYNLTLKDEGYFRGEVISSADNGLIQDSAIEILFESEDNIIFVTETIADEGLFGSTIDYGKIDLPNGAYTVTEDLERYESYEEIFVENGETDKKDHHEPSPEVRGTNEET